MSLLQCLSVMFANILGKQIERQRYLLAKEARKDERRRRKARLRLKDSFSRAFRNVPRYVIATAWHPPVSIQPPFHSRPGGGGGRERSSSQHQYAQVDETAEHGDSTYSSPPLQLRPDLLPDATLGPSGSSSRLQDPEKRRSRAETLDRLGPPLSPTDTASTAVEYAGGLRIEELSTERIRPKDPKYQRPKPRGDAGRHAEKQQRGRHKRDEDEADLVPRSRRQRSEGGVYALPPPASSKERRRRKKSAPAHYASNNSTLMHPVREGNPYLSRSLIPV